MHSDNQAEDAIAKLCEELCEQFPKRRFSLERMLAICSSAASQGRTDFSFRAVADLCAVPRFPGDLVGPVVGTIRNAGGEPFRLLSRAFSELTAPLRKGAGRRVITRQISTLTHALAAADLHIQLHVAKLEQQVDALRAELRQARSQRTPIIVFDEDQPIVQPTPALELSNQEVHALRASIASAALAAQHFRTDEEGRVLDASGITLQRAGFYSAVEKVLSFATKAR